MTHSEEKSINPEELPEHGVFERKEIYQHKQPADTGTPLTHPEDRSKGLPGKEADKTSSQQGLNEARSAGDDGAFEGLEGDRDVDE